MLIVTLPLYELVFVEQVNHTDVIPWKGLPAICDLAGAPSRPPVLLGPVVATGSHLTTMSVAPKETAFHLAPNGTMGAATVNGPEHSGALNRRRRQWLPMYVDHLRKFTP